MMIIIYCRIEWLRFPNVTSQRIDIQHIHILEGVTNLLQILCSAENEAKVTICHPMVQSQEAGPSDDRPTKVQTSQKKRKVWVLPKEVDLGTSELNNMVSDISHVSVDMFVLPMFLLHNIQKVVVE